MSGVKTMYRLKPIIKFSGEMELPKCMYNLKNIQQSHDNSPNCNLKNTTRSISEQCPLSELSALENRQEVILEQLAHLKSQMAKLREELKETKPMPTHRARSNNIQSIKTDIIHDMVINANPNHPPYFIIALKRLWSDSVVIQVSCHTHSSISKLPERATYFTSFLNNSEDTRNLPLVNITLAWKNIGADPELVVSPLKHIVINGEVNILRYFARLGPSWMNYEQNESPLISSVLDSFLDICHQLSHSKEGKERQALLQILISHLKQQNTNAMSVVDVAAWSLFKKFEVVFKNQYANLSNWFDHCSRILQISS